MTEAQEILLENYKNPQHFGEPIFKPTHSTSVLNPLCGDEITLWCHLDSNGFIVDISFKAQGCSIAIASASLLYSHILANKINIKDINEDLVTSLVGIELTPARLKCALLSLNAISRLKSL